MLKKLRKNKLFITILLIILALIIFTGGYELAVYESNSGQSFFWPHLNLGNSSSDTTCSDTSINCPYCHDGACDL